MCGFVGILSNNSYSREYHSDNINRMLVQIEHRGPDSSGLWADKKTGVSFGHRRLSIIDLSEHGAQPMESKSNRYVITYNGEIYNFKEIKKELDNIENNKWEGGSDTEVILAAIDYWGIEKALTKFNGMFAFALWDKQEHLLHLARDRIGIKPLYWSLLDSNFIFSSELKSLMAYEKFNFEIDKNTLALYMKYKYSPCPATIFKKVHQLNPGTLLTFDKNNNIKESKYWNIEKIVESGINKDNTNEELVYEEVSSLLDSAVKYRLVSDVSIGAFLSGGIDSSAIVALMQNNSSSPIDTFSIGFSNQSYDESLYADEVAKYLGTNHNNYILDYEDAIDIIPKLPQIYDEPFSDSSQLPTYLISHLTSKNVKVALSGDGGDEIFGGYNRYLYADKYSHIFSSIPAWMLNIPKTLIHSLPEDSWSNLFQYFPKRIRHSQTGDKLYKLASVIGKNNESSYRDLISDWQFDEDLIYSDEIFQDIDLDFPSYLNEDNLVEYMQLMDQRYYLPNDILTKVDRASMANSLEVRVPYLDHRIIEMMWGLPRKYKINNGVSKILLRKILGKHLGKIKFERAKTGFSMPISKWLRGPLRDWAESLLTRDVINNCGLLNYEVINKKWNEHKSGKNNWHEYIWSVLMFNAWHEKWIEKK